MNKKWKDGLILLLLSIVIIALPTYINLNRVEKYEDLFYSRVDEDFEACKKYSAENATELRMCREIKSSAELAFRSSSSVSRSYSNFSIIQIILFIVLSMVFILQRRVDTLEEK